MSYNNNRGRQLEADPERLQFGYLNIDVNRPPYVPPVQPPLRELNGWLPYIAGRLAELVQVKAQDNPLRTYMFNMCAANNFANGFFDEVVISAMDLAAWLMATQNYSDRDAVETAVEDMNDMIVAVNCRDYPDLWNYIDQNVMGRGIEDEIRKFDQVGRDLTNWKRQSQGNSGSGRRGGTYQAPSGRGNNNGGYSRGGVPSSGSSYSARNNTGGSRNDNQGSGRPAWRDRRNDRNDRQEEPAQQVETRQEPVAPVQKEIPAVLSAWRPSRAVPYFLAYDMTNHIATLRTEEDGSLRFNITEKGENMDYNAHATPNAFGKPPAFLDLSNAARSIEHVRSGIKRTNAEAELPPPEEGKPSLRTTISDKWIFESSESAAWLMANLERQLRDTGDRRADVYRVYGVVSDTVLTLDDENHFIVKLSQTKTFVGLKGLLETLGGEMSQELVNVINRRMTSLVNRKIALELGMDLSIDSFREDIEALIELLDTKWGVKGQFLKNQQAEITRTLLPMQESLRQKFVDNITVGMDFGDAKPNVACVTSLYSMTFIDMLSWEINIEVGNGAVPVRVTPELTPMYYDLVKGAFDDAAGYHIEGSTESSVGRVLFRTLDGRILEGSKGALVDGSYLLTLID